MIGDVRGQGLFVGFELVRDRETLEPAADEASEMVNRAKDLGNPVEYGRTAAQRNQDQTSDCVFAKGRGFPFGTAGYGVGGITMNEVLTYSATSQARLIRERKISSVELVEAHLEQIAKVNPSINAVVEVLDAIPAAREADRTLSSESGPLHGVPFSIKDSIEAERDGVYRWNARTEATRRPPRKTRRWWRDCVRPAEFRLRARICPTCCSPLKATTCSMAQRIILTTDAHIGWQQRGEAALIASCGSPSVWVVMRGQRARCRRHFAGSRASSRPRGDCRARAIFLPQAAGLRRSGRSVRWRARQRIW